VKITAKFDRSSPPAEHAAPAPPRSGPPRAPTDPSTSSAARNLALAHHIDRLIERGLVADFTAAARMLGVSQPRLTHLMGLLLLAPEIQTAVLFDELRFGDKELRVLARTADWREQTAYVARRTRSS
jgi:hypothetical protein